MHELSMYAFAEASFSCGLAELSLIKALNEVNEMSNDFNTNTNTNNNVSLNSNEKFSSNSRCIVAILRFLMDVSSYTMHTKIRLLLILSDAILSAS